MDKRSWGRYYSSRVEVLEPPELRERVVAGKARRLVESYSWYANRGDMTESDTLDQTFASYFGG